MCSRQSDFGFRLMAAELWIRDLLRPRQAILAEVGVQPGMCVLDFGCGPGSYVLPAAELVGDSGLVYALDTHPLAIAAVCKRSARKNLVNVRAIRSDCNTGLGDREVDVVLLYDVLHDLANRREVLRELHRVLKPEGVLSVSDHHLSREQLVSRVTNVGGLFRLQQERRWTVAFARGQT